MQHARAVKTNLREKMPYQISVVIPVYNESKQVEKTLEDVHAYLSKNVENFELLIVDDGSTDQTVELVKKTATRLSKLKILENKINQGKGASVIRGLGEAQGEYLVFMDADQSTKISELAALPRLLETGAQIFISSRHLSSSQIDVDQNFLRQSIGRLANGFIQVTSLPGIRDTQNGFKIFEAIAFKKIQPYLSLERWLFDVEMLFVARKLGIKIVEFPVRWNNRSDSRFSLKRDFLNTSGEFVAFFLRRLGGKYYSVLER